MERKVIVLTPNARRQTINVTVNTTLLQILEEACIKHGLDSDDYRLTHHNKEMDLTQIFRFSGLPNNCLLEMSLAEKKRVTVQVDICIQLEDGKREQGKFQPSDNVWHVATKLAPDAAALFDSPVSIYMRQEIVGEIQMLATTLKSLGITKGRALIRFINRKPETLKIQANVYVPPVVKEKTNDSDEPAKNARSSTINISGSEGGGGGFVITNDLMQSLKKPTSIPNEPTKNATPLTAKTEIAESNLESKKKDKPVYDWGTGMGRTIRSSHSNTTDEFKKKETIDNEMDVEPEVIIIGERKAIVYSMDATQKQIIDLPDSFFDLTVNDLKMVLRDLREISTGNENAPLLTMKMRELEENNTMLKKLGTYKNCVIRVQFPDRHVLQGIFKPIEKVPHLLDFVRTFLHNPQDEFCLFTTPPKNILPLDKTLLELDFVPTAVVHFAFVEGENNPNETYLKAEYLEKLTSAEGAIFAANKWRISNRRYQSIANNDDSINPNQLRSPGASTGAIPKRSRND